jgi:hypothetical protein
MPAMPETIGGRLMYGKLFASTFTGSMIGAGSDVFAVWGYVIANTFDSTVELNPVLVAAIIGTAPANVQAAIDFLCRPDSMSRNKSHDGCRLVHEGAFQYHVVSHSLYRAMRNDLERREYNRVKKRESRDKLKKNKVSNNLSAKVSRGQPRSAHTETETETETPSPPESEKEPRAAVGGLGVPNGKSNAPLSPAEGSSLPNNNGDEATFGARAVIDDLGFNEFVYRAVYRQALVELNDGATKEEIRDHMVRAWREYQRCDTQGKLRTVAVSAERFYSEGKWKNSKLWGLKKGVSAWN